MKKLDRATLIELQWRDLIFWPVTRPLGILYEYVITAIVKLIRLVIPRRDATAQIEDPLDTAVRKEIFTLANLASFYGLFLIGELFYVIWAFTTNQPSVELWSISAWLLDLKTPGIWTIAWLVTEIVLTDTIDGPLARTNARVSALGTLLDHTRDYLVTFVALFFLIAITAIHRDWAFLALAVANAAGLALFISYHVIFFKKIVVRDARMLRDAALSNGKRWSAFFKHALLEEYQTNLTGRIHFTALAFTVGSGLFYYATGAEWIYITFTIALTATIVVTSYYLYELWGEYYARWQVKAHARSQSFKERVARRIERKKTQNK
ncbi:hypothetical protein A3A20_01960 [Candidatus Wolfebacteria bacterium RIFCSPLOWO2_01_FULL_45_19]|uniref:CDP-alcohol phosphatidyltransferase n=1 Tax=Candidatus Wolfebacteria bacterium RIFCSPLOWO2_01_FULL_45_19 TaxID=1802557 RepID=A0A1F8DUL8_9BACT|nr:MAG: hypothetical protein UX23_C0001G0032 [Parcubacteria group bacterium GW2011_GWB1_45_9]OGM91679.1 MAG: hypothetical protein A3A20_01960 [Candidatus Wolfebacteria bacterium RIFCSPLOWO2_01_FULL_45_19]